MKMNKSHLISKINLKISDLNKEDVEEGVKEILKFISQELSKKNRIEIRGFGSFSTRKRSPRMSRNPKTGESIIIKSKYYSYFRPSRGLKPNSN